MVRQLYEVCQDLLGPEPSIYLALITDNLGLRNIALTTSTDFTFDQ